MVIGNSRKGIGGWKRGARAGNYTAMQLNIACRVRNGKGPGGAMAYTAPACPTVTQAKISLGMLPYGTCGKTMCPSVCSALDSHPLRYDPKCADRRTR